MNVEEKACAVQEKITSESLKKLGLHGAAEKLERLTSLRKKMMVAYEHYRYLTPEKIDAFNKKLLNQTYDLHHYTYQQLSMTPLEMYTEIPPAEVLTKLQGAIDRQCFDRYEVAHIVTQTKVPDPLLLGIIDGCKDKFFIGQWDDDVKIEDILKEHEG